MMVIADNYQFNFKTALSAFVFDEKTKSSPYFHGVPMKAVDVIAEFEDSYLFIEIKDYDNPAEFEIPGKADSSIKGCDHFNWLRNYLKYKFRDSLLYRYAENKVDKPIHYLCLLNFDNALNNHMRKELRKELPVGKASNRWSKKLAESCQVIDEHAWRRNFPTWELTRIP